MLCPSILYLDLSEVKQSLKDRTLSATIIDNSQKQALDIALKQNTHKTYVYKGSVNIFAFIGIKNSQYQNIDNLIQIPKGSESDSIYTHTSSKYCKNEIETEKIILHKQWCSLKIILDVQNNSNNYTYSISGNWNGISLINNKAIAGQFLCIPRSVGQNIIEARIPRQGDNSLVLNIYSKTNRGKSVNINIGELIDNQGYSWEKDDLDDIIIHLDKSLNQIDVKIVDWEKGNNKTTFII